MTSLDVKFLFFDLVNYKIRHLAVQYYTNILMQFLASIKNLSSSYTIKTYIALARNETSEITFFVKNSWKKLKKVIRKSFVFEVRRSLICNVFRLSTLPS